MPAIRSAIDARHPCPLGLVTVHAADPTLLGRNHQVLAWGYEDSGATTTVKVYDPNLPGDDEVAITFDHSHPAGATTFNYSGSDTILGFFPITWYRPANPSPLQGHPPAWPASRCASSRAAMLPLAGGSASLSVSPDHGAGQLTARSRSRTAVDVVVAGRPAQGTRLTF